MTEIETTVESKNFSEGFIAGHSEGMKEAALECIKIIKNRVQNFDMEDFEAICAISDIKQHFGIEQ